MKQPRTIIESRPAPNGGRYVGRANDQQAITSAEDYCVGRRTPYAVAERWTGFEAPTAPVPGSERYANQRLPQTSANRFTQTSAVAGGLTQDLETAPRSAVMEERSRLAREIHDTLVQEFAGILLHLEAAKVAADSEFCSISEC